MTGNQIEVLLSILLLFSKIILLTAVISLVVLFALAACTILWQEREWRRLEQEEDRRRR